MKQEYPNRVWEPTRIIEVETKDGTEDLQLWASRPHTIQDTYRRKEVDERLHK